MAAAPPALLPLGTLPTSTAALICGLLSEGNNVIIVTLPIAFSSGGSSGGAVARSTAYFIPPTVQGCGTDLLTTQLGFTADSAMVVAADPGARALIRGLPRPPCRCHRRALQP
jgi:hypothetical protein